MAQPDGAIIIDLQLQQDEFEERLSQLEGKTSSFGSKIKKALIGIGIGAMAKKAVGYIYGVGSSFEETMSKVQAISGATSSELDALTSKAKEMGAKTKFSATEAGEAFTYMAMAGWKTEDMLDGIEGIMNLAAASGEDLAQVSDIVTDALTAFGLSAKDSAHFADVLAKASSASNTNVSMLGETFKYVAPVAGALGYSVEDTAVAIGLMANSGIKASQAGTALRSIFTRLTKPTDQVAGAMEALNISMMDSSGNIKPLNVLMGDLRKAFSGLTDAQKTEMAATLGGQEAMSGLLAIVNASDKDYQSLTKQINNADGAAQQMAQTMQNNLKGSLTIMQSALEGIGISIYEKVSPALKGFVDFITNDVLSVVNDLVNGDLSKLDEIFIEGIPNAIDGLLTMLQSLGDYLTESAPMFIDKGFEMLSNLVQGIINAIPIIIQQLPKVITTFANIINDNFPTILMKGAELLWQLITGILSAIPDLIANIPQIIEAIWSTIMAFNWLNLGKNIIDFLGKGIKSMFNFIKSNASGIAKNIWDALTHLPQTLWNLGKNMISKLGSAITNTTGTVGGAIKGVFNAVVNGIKSLPSKMLDIGSNIVKGLWNGIKNVTGWIKDKIGGFVDDIVGGIKSFFGIHSPSTVMRDMIGKYLPPGIAVGFELAMPKSMKSMGNDIDKMTNDMQKRIDMNMSDMSASAYLEGNVHVTKNKEITNSFPKSMKMEGGQDVYLVTADGTELAHWFAPYIDKELKFD